MAKNNNQNQEKEPDGRELDGSRAAELEEQLAEKDSRLSELEQALAERDGQISTLKRSVAELETQMNGLKDGQSQAIASYRALVIKSNPDLPEELISGDSVEEIDKSLAGYCPDFTINPGNGGDTVIQRLLSFVPDVFFIEGNTACVVNPLAGDDSDYAYGSAHAVFEGRYRWEGWGLNHVQVEGYDPGQGEAIVVDTFSWGEVDRLYDRLIQVEDRNLDTVTKAGERGEAYLRQAEMEAADGAILTPVNCGQQLYDVVDITDSCAGLGAAKRRVIGLTLVYRPRRGEYQQRLLLGGV
jgi:uncharacterized coiled-coil protein SlyX